MHYTQEADSISPEDRAAFVRDNAASLLGDRDATIRRQREAIARLERGRRDLRRRLAAAGGEIVAAAARSAAMQAQLRRLGAADASLRGAAAAFLDALAAHPPLLAQVRLLAGRELEALAPPAAGGDEGGRV